MTHSPRRRTLLLTAALVAPCSVARTAFAARAAAAPETALADLERTAGGRLGVCLLDAASGRTPGRYRADERFPFCSTFKIVLVGAILARDARTADFLRQRVRYARSDVVRYSPVTEKHVADGMTVAELCQAALQHSDNTSANLLMDLLGGPPAVTAFARSIGDQTFRLDRRETTLNSAVPGDPRDTSTPAAMARSTHALVLGNALPAPQRTQLQGWLRGNEMGAHRIRAGIPAGWLAGDKTGTGDYGATNDVAVLWPPAGAPLVLAVYFTQQTADAAPRDDVIAAAARIVTRA